METETGVAGDDEDEEEEKVEEAAELEKGEGSADLTGAR